MSIPKTTHESKNGETYDIYVDIPTKDGTILPECVYYQLDLKIDENLRQTFCSATALANMLAIHYNNYNIKPMDFKKSFLNSFWKDDYSFWADDKAFSDENGFESVNNDYGDVDKIEWEKNQLDKTTKGIQYVNDIKESLSNGQPVLITVLRWKFEDDDWKPKTHFVTIIGIRSERIIYDENGVEIGKEKITLENAEYTDFVMIDPGTNKGLEITTMDNTYKQNTPGYPEPIYYPYNYRIIAPYIVDENGDFLIGKDGKPISDYSEYEARYAEREKMRNEFATMNIPVPPQFQETSRNAFLNLIPLYFPTKESPYKKSLENTTFSIEISELAAKVIGDEDYEYFDFSEKERNALIGFLNTADLIAKSSSKELAAKFLHTNLLLIPGFYQGYIFYIVDNFLLPFVEEEEELPGEDEKKPKGDTSIYGSGSNGENDENDENGRSSEGSSSGSSDSDGGTTGSGSTSGSDFGGGIGGRYRAGITAMIPRFLETSLQELSRIQKLSSPIVLDLDNNGFETQSKQDGVYFDLDNNGFAEKTAWTSGDAFLTYDLNENGKIDNGGELFGNYTKLENGKNAKDGFAALAQYDENEDGVIDENDDIYRLIKLWNDDGDGISEDGEFKTLEEMGVTSIDLTQTAPETAAYTDATVSGVSSAEMADGTSRTVADFWFNVSTADTMQIYDGEFDADILALPDVRSFGKMPSLRVAMQMDESGELKELVESFTASGDIDERDLIIKQILYKLTGADTVSPTSRGSLIDARDLHVVETVLGAKYTGQSGRPATEATNALNGLFSEIKKLYTVLLSAEYVNDYLRLINFTEENGQISFDASLFNLYIDLSRKLGNEIDNILCSVSNYLYFIDEDKSSYNEFAAHYLNISVENKKYFNFDSSYLIGTDGDDTITGSNLSEKFNAGKGDDIISGGRGNDIYYFNRGDGKDTLTDYDNGYSDSRSDKIVFGDGISAETTYMTRQGDDLIIRVNGDIEDEIIVKSYFSATYYQIENIIFADGTVWTTADISTKSAQIFGSNEDDVISAFTGGSNYSLNQTVYAYEGNDTITGSSGSETIFAGKGNDTVSGGRGNDTYYFNLGDGKDTLTDYDNGYSDSRSDKIIFGEGISEETTYMTRLGNNLVIRVNGDTEDEITIKDYFSATYYQIESVVFDSGTIWTTADIATKSAQIFGTENDDEIKSFTGGANYSLNQTIYAYEGDDTITGSNGSEMFFAGKGDDTVIGGRGNDTYYFNLGDGKDILTDYDNGYSDSRSDKIVFGEGISSDTTYMTRHGNDLIIKINGDTEDEITVKSYFSDSYYQIESIIFNDGTIWTTGDISTNSAQIFGSDEDDTISTFTGGTNYSLNQTVYAYEGDDTITGSNGSEKFITGKGDDTVSGGRGNDTYFFNLGDGKDTITDYDNGYSDSRSDKIIFGDGISADKTYMTRQSNDLIIKVNGDTTDEITISNYFSASYYQIENITFADGSVWTTADISTKSAQIFGSNEDDVISAFTGGSNYSLNQTIFAYEGNDTITGSNGSEIFFAGKGNDIISGGRGNDTYYFNLGDGKDTLTDYDNGYSDSRSDKIVFGEGISAEKTYMTRLGNNLIIKINGDTEDEIVIKDYFSASYYQIEKISFADGTVWTTADISTKSAQIFGSNEDDVISAFTGGSNYSLNQKVYAYEGNDTITGSNGSETFVAGSGDDTVSGGRGNDTYVFNLGDGKDILTDYDNGYSDSRSDKIVFGEGISADKTYMTRKSNDLVIRINGDTEDEITVKNYFSATYYQIESITFNNGTIWTTADISTKSAQIFGSNEDDTISTFTGGANYSLNQTIYTYEGNDTISGSNGNETFIGGKGNDSISGSGGNDTYIFNLGDGKDTITDNNSGYTDSDKIIFGEGIETSDLIFSRQGYNLLINISGTDDTITIKNHYYTQYYRIENFQTADGSTLTYTNIEYLIQAMAEFTADTGMTVSEAAQENNQAYSDIVNQMWVSQTVA